MIHSFEFKSFYTCDAYAIIFFIDKQHFIYNENLLKRTKLFNRVFYKL